MIATYNVNKIIQVMLYPEEESIPENGLSGKIILLNEKTENNVVQPLNLQLIESVFYGDYHCRVYDTDFGKKIFLNKEKFDEIFKASSVSMPYVDGNFNNGHTIEFLYSPMHEQLLQMIKKIHSKLF